MVTVKGKVIKGMLATLTILGYHHIFIGSLSIRTDELCKIKSESE